MKRLRGWLSSGVIGLIMAAAAAAQGPFSQGDIDNANALLTQMTVAEKIGQLNQPFYFKLPIPGAKSDPVSYEDHVRRG